MKDMNFEETYEYIKDMGRRDAFKKMGLLGATPFINLNAGEKKSEPIRSKAKIAIVGGGAAGISMAARLSNEIENPQITLIEPSERHVYQAGHTLVGAGIIDASKLIVSTSDFIPDGVEWMRTKATNIDPDAQKVNLEDGVILDYDYLLICTGLQFDWKRIEELDPSMIGQNGINTIYTLEGAQKTWKNLQEFAKTGGEALYTHPDTPIKCGGAPKKVLYLSDDYMRNEGLRDKTNITFLANSSKLFSVPVFEKAIEGHFKDRDIGYDLKHNLVKIDSDKKIATFKTQKITRGAWDEDLEEYDEIIEDIEVEKPYDFIHITPPMSAPDFLKGSKVAWDKGSAGKLGLIKVDKHTLQHMKYKNIFSLGDVAGTPIGKTGATVRKQVPIVVQNMLDVMAGRDPSAKFDGYTACPIITRYGKVMLAEFGYDMEPTPTIPGLAVAEERWMWWIMKVYILEPMYFYGMLRGRA